MAVWRQKNLSPLTCVVLLVLLVLLFPLVLLAGMIWLLVGRPGRRKFGMWTAGNRGASTWADTSGTSAPNCPPAAADDIIDVEAVAWSEPVKKLEKNPDSDADLGK